MPLPWFLRPGSRKRPSALVLGGGGARGLAHVGVLQVMEEHGCTPDMIVGTSIGAVIGAMYAQHARIETVREKLQDFFASSFFESVGLDTFYRRNETSLFPVFEEWIQGLRMRLSATRTLTHEGMIPAAILREGLEMLLDDTAIEDCRIPYACVAVDLRSGEPRTLRSGSIRDAVAASSSIPGIIAPTVIDGRSLVDGAVTSATPALEARAMGARTVVIIDVSRDLNSMRTPKVGFEIMQRAGDIAATRCNERHLEDADHVLRPEVRDYHWARFDKAETLIGAGAQTAQEHRRMLCSVFSKRRDDT